MFLEICGLHSEERIIGRGDTIFRDAEAALVVIPVIPFFAEIRDIRETVETVAALQKVLEPRVNTVYSRYL